MSNMARQSSNSRCPADVTAKCEAFRSTSFAPIWVSSRFSALLTVGCFSDSLSPAAVRLFSCTITMKVRSRFQSISQTKRRRSGDMALLT